MTRTITLVGARAGQGTSTTAAALATTLAADSPVSLLAHDPLALASLLGAPPVTPGSAPVEVSPNLTLSGLDGPRRDVTVIDAGAAATAPARSDGERYAVVRGPCYLALATLVSLPGFRLDGAVLIAEPGRALDAHDVAAVLNVPVVATIPFSPTVSRAVDAGVLAIAARDMNAFRPLRACADRQLDIERVPSPHGRARNRPSLAVSRSSQQRAASNGCEVEL